MCSGDLRADELADFYHQLARLQESLQGTAKLVTMEGWLSITVEGDGRGHKTCCCVVRDEPGIGNTLECEIVTDQTLTRATVADLAAVTQEFPVIGKRDGG